MRKFKFAGVSKVDGRLALRASNRDNYDAILTRDKNTAIQIIELDKPMTKDQIREVLLRRKAFQTPAIKALLLKGEVPPARKVVKKAKKAASKKSAQPAASAVAA